jgi:hypothetical protein
MLPDTWLVVHARFTAIPSPSRRLVSSQVSFPSGQSGTMSDLVSGVRVRLGIGGVTLLVIHSLVAPRDTQAGCNHLVGSRERIYASAALTHLDALVTGRASDTVQSHQTTSLLPHSRHEQPQPCSGPSCLGRVPLPLSTAEFEARTLDRWGAISEPPAPAQLPVWHDGSGDIPLHATENPSCIFHPPRLAS